MQVRPAATIGKRRCSCRQSSVTKRCDSCFAMADPYVSDELRSFILKRIDSVVQIEALLLIRSGAQSHWNATGLAKRLYIAESEAAEALNRLCAAELLICVDGNYRVDGIPLQNLELLEELLGAYSRHLIPVTNIVHSKSRRIGSFADAFKFRKGS